MSLQFCALSHFSHWSPLVLTSGLSIFFKEPLAPLAASFISRVFSSIQPLKSRLFLLTLPLWGLPSRQGSRSREIEVCSVHCRPAEREEEAWLHTPVPRHLEGSWAGDAYVCLPEAKITSQWSQFDQRQAIQWEFSPRSSLAFCRHNELGDW